MNKIHGSGALLTGKRVYNGYIIRKEGNMISIDEKEFDKVLDYRYNLFIEVNKHIPSRSWNEAVLERDLVQKMSATDTILKTLGLFNYWLSYCKERSEQENEK